MTVGKRDRDVQRRDEPQDDDGRNGKRQTAHDLRP